MEIILTTSLLVVIAAAFIAMAVLAFIWGSIWESKRQHDLALRNQRIVLGGKNFVAYRVYVPSKEEPRFLETVLGQEDE